MKNRRRLWIVLATVCTFLICAGLCVGLILHRESELDDIQNEALEELRDHRGEYDEKSIVLYDTNRGEAQALAEKFGAKLRISFDGKFATLTLPGDVTVEDIYSARGNRKYIADMALDYQVKTSEITDAEEDVASERLPTRPQYSVSDEDYALQGYLDYLNMKDVWNWSTGYNVTVAVIDTGIDTDHPEFAGRISEYSYNATEDKIVKDYLLEDGSYDWSLVEDEQGHGTAVTGVIAASMNDGKVVGIAPNVTIITIKAECDENGRFARTSDLVFGLYYAIERDVDVVNMSFGGTGDFSAPAQLARDSDIICVAAAGNDGTAGSQYPAADPNVFGVGALEADGWNLASYSNYGENVNLVAPGTTYTTLMGGKYGTMNGTSLASPVVTGAIALYLSVNYYQEFLTVEEVLYASCYDLGDLGCDYYYGYGALDISALIMEERGTVTFNMMTDELENTEQLFIRNHTLQNMPEPERLYAIFDGWYYDPHCTEEYNWYVDQFSTDLTLYAKWVNEEDGIPFTYVELEDGTIEIRSYTGHRRYITIPDMIDGKIVSSIGEGAFAGETRLREVILPKELKRIRRSAFEGCNNLVHIDLPDTVTEIAEKAFFNNVRLSYVGIGGNSQLQSIGNFAFSNCVKLQRFELPANVASVNGSAFFGATNLTAFTVRAGNKNFTAKDGVLFNYTQSTLVAYPAGLRGEYTIPTSVLAIGDYAFGYARFDGINLDTVQIIGSNAFANSELESIIIPDTVTSMGESAFENNFYLRSVQLGNGLTAISPSAFSMCTVLEQIEIPANIREIKSRAFSATPGMTSVTFAPDSKLTIIGERAFAGSGLSSVAFPASVISIGGGAFAEVPLVSVTFAENSQLRTIGGEAFKGTYRLTSIDLPEQLTSLGAFAFMESGLEKVTIPASLTSFGAGAFAACHSLTAITVEEANTVYTDVAGVVYDKAKTTLIEYPAGNTRSDYTVLNTVTALEEDAFYGSWNLYTVYLSESLQEIRREAFFDCQGLNYIQIPDNVMQISNLAFAQCWNLTSVYLNDTSNLPRISYEAFAYCGLQSFRVPANVSTMAQGAFTGCYNLTSFTFAENSKLESISAYMFDGCDNLQSITFEEGSALTSIQAHGLEGMRKLTSVDFGDAKITNIDNFAFRFCESLTRVDLPEGVTEIGRYAFYYCTSLNEVSIPTSVEFIGRFAFLGTQNLNVYFASETLPAYLQEDWDYGTAGYYLGVTDVITDGDWKYAKLTSGDIAIIQYNGTETNIDLTALDFGGDIVNMGGEAFAYSAVESIVLPETLVTIQNEAFYHSALKSVSIPASVDFIGRSAFADTPIETLTFANSAQLCVIEQSAFEGTKSLGSVTLPKSLTTIGRAIFKNSGITSLTFEDGIGITEISEEAFAYTNITTVTIPDSVTLLNHSAFRETKQLKSVDFGNSEDIMIMSNVFYHSGLTNLHIPANVTYVGEYAFVALTKLQSFTVDADHPQYRAIDGLLVTKDGRKLIAAPAGREGTLTVPEGIEIIGFGAFEESKLTKINFLADANILSFGYRAFYGSAITEMHVPASVVAIDYYAFATCKNLTKVTFAEDNQLRGIYEGAFYACPNLYDITLPDAIVEISDFAFYGCKKIDKLPISNTSTIKGIYDYAFAYAGLEGAFTTPETLIDIGAHAFMGNKFTSVTVPDTNAYDLVIGIGAFEGCNDLQEITLPFIGASFEDPDYTWFGYIFGAGGYEANSTYVPESLKKVTIAEGISFVGEGAFYGIKTVEEIDVPHSVTMLYDYAFGESTVRYELTSPISTSSNTVDSNHFGKGISGKLILSEGIYRIENRAFENCVNLTNIEIPNTVTGIGGSVFYGCSNLLYVEIPEGIETIGVSIFMGCQQLREVSLPNTLKTIGRESFYNCTSLMSINIPKNVTSIGDSAFRDCGLLKNVVFAEDSCLESIGYEAFVNCNALTNIVLPQGVTIIDDFAFHGCGLLKNIIFAEDSCLKSIGYAAFADCCALTNIALPQGVTNISDYAFSGCSSIEEISIPEGVTSLGNVFGGCTALKSITIPSSVTYIDFYLFPSCTSLENIIIDENNDSYCAIDGIVYNKPITKIVYVQKNNIFSHVTIPEGVTEIQDSAFWGCHNLNSITLPSTLLNIERGAFAYCSNLTTLNIPYGVTNIGESAFMYCINLTNINIPNSITSIGDSAFFYCNSLSSIVIPAGVTSIGSDAFSSCTSLKRIDIPNSITSVGGGLFRDCYSLLCVTLGEGVVNIDRTMFAGCTKLTSITLGKGVSSIEEYAFSNCEQLHFIYNNSDMAFLPGEMNNGWIAYRAKLIVDKDGNKIYYSEEDKNINIETMDEFLFEYIGGNYRLIAYLGDLETVVLPMDINGNAYTIEKMVGVKNVIIPDDGKIGLDRNAFSRCTTLTSITIGSGVEKISDYAFEGCSNLTNVTIPNSVTSIGYGAFENCVKLVSIEVPNSVTYIGDSAFWGCTSLANIIISQNISNIRRATFYNCKSLVCVNLPEGLISIGDRAFTGCINLTSVTIPKNVKSISPSAFAGCKNINLKVSTDNLMFTEKDGILYNADFTKIVYIPESVTVICVPNTITDFSFEGNTNIKCVSFESGCNITEFGSYQFRGCTSLASITIPDSITSIGYGVFDGCSSLTNVVLPENLETIGERAFAGCTNLSNINIPDGVVSIGDWAFAECSNIISIIMTDSVVSIGRYAFEYCTALKEITLSNKITEISYSMFNNCQSLKNITIPSGVTSINESAFCSCTALEYIDIPNGVTKIGESAFSYCTSLADITIPKSVVNIGRWAFERCDRIEKVTVSKDNENYCMIDGILYDKPTTSIVLVPSNVSGHITIPEGVTYIPDSAFEDCVELISIMVPDSVTNIGYSAFAGCTNLKSITLPNSIERIEESTFMNCSNLLNIIIPNSVTSIGRYAFLACDKLMSITISDNLTTIEDMAFSACGNLCIIYNNSNLLFIPGNYDYGGIAVHVKMIINNKTGETQYRTEEEDTVYIKTAEDYFFKYEKNEYRLIAYLGNEVIITLPANINGQPYTIDYMATIAQEIIIPENSKINIGWGAFSGCDTLTSITIGNGITSIGSSAFYNCSNLTKVILPDSITSIEHCAFEGCTGLTSIVWSSNIVSVGWDAFKGCINLENISISDNASLGSVHYSVFLESAYYNNLNNWENGALYIGNHLIKVCEDVEYFILPANISSIADGAFNGCYKLKHLTIDGEQAGVLSNLTNLETLVITEMPDSNVVYFAPITLKNIVLADGVRMNSYAFGGITNVTIYVEANEKDVRWDENFPGWNNGNKVVYGNKWIYVDFYDNIGIKSKNLVSTSQIIRVPFTDDYFDGVWRYVFQGFDSNGDGVADVIPATSTTDIVAYAIYQKEYRCVQEGHLLDEASCLHRATCLYCNQEFGDFADHDFGDWYEIKAPTCTATGIDERECFVCHEKETRTTDALGHTNAIPVIENKVDATCTKDGSYDNVVYCSVCQAEISREQKIINKLGHDYSIEWTVDIAPTCTIVGSKSHHCTRCNDKADVTEISATGHSWSNWYETQAPTCITTGIDERECSVCHEKEARTTDALGHTNAIPVIENKINATCIADGHYDSATYCSVCQAEINRETKVIEKLGHGEILHSGKPATCTTSGWKEYVTCSRCDHTTYEVIEALGHDEIPHSGKAPTCTEYGWKEYVTCSRCDYSTYEELPATGHKASEWIIDEEATYEKDGHKHKECIVCGEILEESTIPMLSHTYVSVVTPPTCTEQGYTTHTCSDCGNSYVDDYVPATGHSWSGWYETQAPTCTATGIDERECSACHEKETRTTDAFGHTNAIPVVENRVEATCTTDGSYDSVTYCSVCKVELIRETRTIVKLGHDYSVEWTVDIAPTCTTVGSKSHHCTRCNDKADVTEISATGHSWSNWYETQAPTCITTGIDERECSVCYTKETRISDALGHTNAIPVIENKIDATCTVNGQYDSVIYCTVCQAEISRETKTIVKLGHDYSVEWTVDVAPTCTTAGSKSHHCTRCDDKADVTEISATGHTLGSWTQVKAPTCTEKGSERRACANCNHFEERQVDALGHNDTSIVTAPTCTEKGYTTHECIRCNAGKYVDSYVDALGHSFTNYVSNNDAIYTEDGTKTAKCDRCNEKNTITDEGSALGMAQKFRDEMAALNKNADTETTYSELYAVLQTYTFLSAKEKEDVAKEFATLQQMINAYNAKAQTANNELAKATENAFAPIAVTSFTFLAALWFLLRKKFLV